MFLYWCENPRKLVTFWLNEICAKTFCSQTFCPHISPNPVLDHQLGLKSIFYVVLKDVSFISLTVFHFYVLLINEIGAIFPKLGIDVIKVHNSQNERIHTKELNRNWRKVEGCLVPAQVSLRFIALYSFDSSKNGKHWHGIVTFQNEI